MVLWAPRKRPPTFKEVPNDESSLPKVWRGSFPLTEIELDLDINYLVATLLVSSTDPAVIEKVDDRLDLLSLPPSLTLDNLDRTLRELRRWPERLSPDDQILYAQHVLPTLIRYFDAVYT